MDEKEYERMKKNAQDLANEYKAKSRPEASSVSDSSQKEENSEAPLPVQKDEGILAALLKDKDRTMILALIILLLDEQEDNSLLLALIYLLLYPDYTLTCPSPSMTNFIEVSSLRPIGPLA